MTTQDFYKDLNTVPLGIGLVDSAHHHDVPDDWSVVIVDIIGSTKAVAQGRYKDVNIAASCSIVAVLNRVGRGQIAYIYGGDGATFLIPPHMCFDVASALHGARQLARDSFDLDMRAGIVGVAQLRGAGADVRVAKIEVRPGVRQASLSGDGIAIAEKMVKDPAPSNPYHISVLYENAVLAETPASFDGFECRWQPLTSRNGVNVSVIVLAQQGIDNNRLYSDVLDHINRVCGTNEDWQPVSEPQLKVHANPFSLRGELKARTAGKGIMQTLAYWWHITLMSWVGIYLIKTGKKAGHFDGATYRTQTAHNSDFIKFDNTLRLVMDIPQDQCSLLENYLEDLYGQGRIFYGIHVSRAALATCLVFDYDGDHFHFIDGSDGGYSLAAKGMKIQIAQAAEKIYHSA